MQDVLGSPGQGDLDQLTNVFRLLSDKTRMNILFLLAQGERNVSSLCEQLKLPQPTVSHHLGLLRLGNMIGNRRAGKQVFYGLNDPTDAGEFGLSLGVDNFTVHIRRNGNVVTPEISARSTG